MRAAEVTIDINQTAAGEGVRLQVSKENLTVVLGAIVELGGWTCHSVNIVQQPVMDGVHEQT